MRASLLGLLLLLFVSVAVLAQQANDETAPEPTASQPAVPGAEGDTPSAPDATAGEQADGTGEAGPEDFDFDPDEEISEDFPVPLPADI